MKIAAIVLIFFMAFPGCAGKTYNIVQKPTSSVAADSVPKSGQTIMFMGIPETPEAQKCKKDDGKKCTTYHKIHGVIDSSKRISFQNWLDSWKEEKKLKNLFIEINSPGGSVFSGFSMYQALNEFKAEKGVKVHCTVNGYGASMAFFMLQACDVRTMTLTSVLLAHNPSFVVDEGTQLNPGTLLELHKKLMVIAEIMSRVISDRLGISAKEYNTKIEHGNWELNYRQAIEANAIDFIVPTVYDYLKSIKAGTAPKKVSP